MPSATSLQAAQAASFFGTGLYSLSSIWTVMQTSPPAAAPLALGGLLLAGFLPGLLLAVPIGHLVDRLPRHRLAVTCDLIRAALLVVIFTAGAVPVSTYLIVAALLAILDEVHEPALGALLRDHTPVKTYQAALARMQIAVQSGWLGGAVTGGLLLWLGDQQGWPVGWPFLLNAASFACSALLIARARAASKEQLHTVTDETAPGAPVPGPLTLTGLVRQPAVAAAAWQLSSLAAVLQLSNLLLPAYVRHSLHQNVTVYGLLEGLYALGALVGAARSASTHARLLSGLLCASLTLIALAPSFGEAGVLLSAAAFFTLGLALSVRIKLWARLQTDLPSAYQGRVHALINGLISATVIGVVALCSVVLTLNSAVPLYAALTVLALTLTLLTDREQALTGN